MAILEMKNISKSFSGVRVLDHVSLTIDSGEIHALLGENGAGKSTLMNILAGVLQPDTGSICFDGNMVETMTVRKSEELGIGFVHQEINLFNDLLVYENIFLGKELVTKTGTLRKKEMIAQTRVYFESLGVDIDPTKLVGNMSVSEKQLLEICKSLFFNAKLLILDEPTTSLNNDEIDHLFELLRKLKAKGNSFIIISHKMPEIFAISDRFTVLRNGKFIKSGFISEVTPTEVTCSMVGEAMLNEAMYTPRELGEVVLSAENLCGKGFSDVSLTLRKGEVLAVTGLQGSGGDSFIEALFGLQPIYSGKAVLNGKELKKISIQKSMKRGIGLLPANRKENSVIPDMSILENMYVSEHVLSARKVHIKRKQEVEKYMQQKKLLNIKAADHNNLIISLSGGNQQKVLFARWLNTKAKILLLENPTQGIDVGAKAEIYQLILQLAKQGMSIIINTLEIPEIYRVADRCAVFYDGKIATILPHDAITEQTVMMYSTNVLTEEESLNVE